MLKRRDDARRSITDNIGVETMVSPGITGSMIIVRKLDLKMTITIGMPIV